MIEELIEEYARLVYNEEVQSLQDGIELLLKFEESFVSKVADCIASEGTISSEWLESYLILNFLKHEYSDNSIYADSIVEINDCSDELVITHGDVELIIPTSVIRKNLAKLYDYFEEFERICHNVEEDLIITMEVKESEEI